VEEVGAGPGFDPDAAVGGGKYDDRASTLKEHLNATPGVGEAGAEYAAYWFDRSVEGPDDLNDLLLEVSGVDAPVARRIVTSIYGDGGGGPDAPAPFTVGGSDGTEGADAGETDTLDAIIRAKQAGLIDSGDSGVDSADVASAVAEAIRPALKQIAQVAEGEDSSQIQALQEEIEELREARRQSEMEKLREKVERLEGGADTDTEVRRLKETRELLSDAPEVSASAVSEWGDLAHSIMDRMQSHARQREIMATEGDNRPEYTPPRPAGRGRPRQQARSAQERPAPGPEVNGGAASAGASDDDGGEPTDSGAAERAQEIRGKLGISEEI
jgi:TolA-binding protein